MVVINIEHAHTLWAVTCWLKSAYIIIITAFNDFEYHNYTILNMRLMTLKAKSSIKNVHAKLVVSLGFIIQLFILYTTHQSLRYYPDYWLTVTKNF
jgi:hypothetical protein